MQPKKGRWLWTSGIQARSKKVPKNLRMRFCKTKTNTFLFLLDPLQWGGSGENFSVSVLLSDRLVQRQPQLFQEVTNRHTALPLRVIPAKMKFRAGASKSGSWQVAVLLFPTSTKACQTHQISREEHRWREAPSSSFYGSDPACVSQTDTAPGGKETRRFTI